MQCNNVEYFQAILDYPVYTKLYAKLSAEFYTIAKRSFREVELDLFTLKFNCALVKRCDYLFDTFIDGNNEKKDLLRTSIQCYVDLVSFFSFYDLQKKLIKQYNLV